MTRTFSSETDEFVSQHKERTLCLLITNQNLFIKHAHDQVIQININKSLEHNICTSVRAMDRALCKTLKFKNLSAFPHTQHLNHVVRQNHQRMIHQTQNTKINAVKLECETTAEMIATPYANYFKEFSHIQCASHLQNCS